MVIPTKEILDKLFKKKESRRFCKTWLHTFNINPPEVKTFLQRRRSWCERLFSRPWKPWARYEKIEGCVDSFSFSTKPGEPIEMDVKMKISHRTVIVNNSEGR